MIVGDEYIEKFIFNYLLKDGKIHFLEELVNSCSKYFNEQKESIKGRITPFRIHSICEKLKGAFLIIEPEKQYYQKIGKNEKHNQFKQVVNLYHSGIDELEEIGEVFTLLKEKGTAFVEEIQTKQMVLDVFWEDIIKDCESRVLYSLKESIENIDKKNKFDEFQKDLIEIFRDILDKLENYDVKVDPYSALTLISDFSFDIFKRILRYNMYRLYLIMAEFKSLNILFPWNFIDNVEFDQYYKKL